MKISAVGIIGGADGPTQILVSSSIHWMYGVIAVIVIAGGIIAALLLKNKHKE